MKQTYQCPRFQPTKWHDTPLSCTMRSSAKCSVWILVLCTYQAATFSQAGKFHKVEVGFLIYKTLIQQGLVLNRPQINTKMTDFKSIEHRQKMNKAEVSMFSRSVLASKVGATHKANASLQEWQLKSGPFGMGDKSCSTV